MSNETKETSGVDSYGDTIPLEQYSKRFSEHPSVLSIFFLDCSRERPEKDESKSAPL
jgi:hypothetical protein